MTFKYFIAGDLREINGTKSGFINPAAARRFFSYAGMTFAVLIKYWTYRLKEKMLKGGEDVGRKRFIVEFGTGADLHGEDVTKAAQKAVKDAVSHSCLCGLVDIFGMKDPNKMHVEIKLGCPYPERVNREEVRKTLPFGTADLDVVPGGLVVPGLKLPILGEGDRIVIVLAALTVYIDTEETDLKKEKEEI